MKKVTKVLNRSMLVSCALIATSSLSTFSFAADENNVAPGLTAAGAPLGLHGADPVAALNKGQAVEGTASFTAIYDGVAYYFSDAKTKQQFTASPAKYIPQNGGFCTFGVSVGKKFDGDPNFASIVDGKLYVFLNEDIYKMFLEDKQGTISKAAKNWQKIEHVAAAEL